ncbi:MAG: DUF86 domain-containing protein [Sedimentisphaerales bacterium]|nr:DUF86 domain-containing protein [Sedimentisphaerales bacterium]
MKENRLYLIHIAECIERVDSYTQGMSREAFLASTLVQDAVIRNLQTLAESTQRLSDRLKEQHPEIVWYRIAGFRNVLVHDYLGLDAEKVWNIVQNELPALNRTVHEMLG